jgi:hypothetical protein
MSSGSFILSKYESEIATNIRNIKVQPETLDLTIATVQNDPPAGAVVAGLGSAQVSQGRRSLGCNARTVTIKFDTAPDGYLQGGLIRLPLLTKAIAAVATKGATGTYLEEAITVVGVSPEKIN